jgi:hypothetical protein
MTFTSSHIHTIRQPQERMRMSGPWTKVIGPDQDGAYRVQVTPDFHEGDGLTLATTCATPEEAETFSGRVEAFFDAMLAGHVEAKEEEALELAQDGQPDDEEGEEEIFRSSNQASDWTYVYWDRHAYVRLIPGSMDTEAMGYSHGLAIEGRFTTKEEALEHGRAIGAEMDAMVASAMARNRPALDQGLGA